MNIEQENIYKCLCILNKTYEHMDENIKFFKRSDMISIDMVIDLIEHYQSTIVKLTNILNNKN